MNLKVSFGLFLLCILSSSLAFEVNSMWEVPLGDQFVAHAIGNVTTDPGQACSLRVYKGNPVLAHRYWGYDFDTTPDDTFVTQPIDDDVRMFAREFTFTATGDHTPIGYAICVYSSNIVNRPHLELFYGHNSTDIVFDKQIYIHNGAGWQCASFTEDPDADNFFIENLISGSPIKVGFRCFDCEDGLREATLDYFDEASPSSYYSDDGGDTWLNTGLTTKEFAITIHAYCNPTGTGLLTHDIGPLDAANASSTFDLRGVPLIDLERYKSQLILDSHAETVAKFKVDTPLVVNDLAYYEMSCGTNKRTGVFKVLPSISIGDGFYNLVVNVYENIGILIVMIIGGVLFAVVIAALVAVLAPVVVAGLGLII